MSSWLGIPTLSGIVIVRMSPVVRTLRVVDAAPGATTATNTSVVVVVVVVVLVVVLLLESRLLLLIAESRVIEVAVPTVHIAVTVLRVDWAYDVRFALGGGRHPNLIRVGSLHANRIVLYLS